MKAEPPGSTGKMAVIKRLEALFKGSAKPIVQTKPFDPAPPYIAMHEIPAKDELTPARMIIVYRCECAKQHSRKLPGSSSRWDEHLQIDSYAKKYCCLFG